MRRRILALALLAAAPGCATRAMRTQAGALAEAGEQLEAETAAFAAARTAVVQLRQRALVERRAEVAERGQQNAATLAQWRVAGTDDRKRRLALYEGVTAASEAMYEVRDQGLLWEESVLYARSALAIDRAALHRFVVQLALLARRADFVEGVKFYVAYGAAVAAQVDAGLQEVMAGVADAQAGPPAGPEGLAPAPTEPSTPGTRPTPVTPVDGPKPPDPNPVPRPNPPTPQPGVDPGPGEIGSGQRRGDGDAPGTLRDR